MNHIPTNLVTGFLGVGKTTTIINLLKRKPTESRWAVLVNEYGEVGIDGALLEGTGIEGVSVKEISGGCVCCATAPFLPVAIHFLLLEARPERLIIETTGLGHPARLIDSLRHNYHRRLDVRATIGLVDPADFAKPEMKQNPIFVEQIQMADVLVMNKLDTTSPELVQDFQQWANELFPPKLLIAGTTHGQLDPAWLDLCSNDERLPLYPPAPSTRAQMANTRGWIFPPEQKFCETKLLNLLTNEQKVTRLKGVFRVEDEWIAVNRSGTVISVTPTAYRRDNRLEVFAQDLDWNEFEPRLLQCLMS